MPTIGDLGKGYYKLRFDTIAPSDRKYVQVVEINKSAKDEDGKKRGSSAIINHSTKTKLEIWLFHDVKIHDVETITEKDLPHDY